MVHRLSPVRTALTVCELGGGGAGTAPAADASASSADDDGAIPEPLADGIMTELGVAGVTGALGGGAAAIEGVGR
jgi:hypothetical protein